MAKEMAPALFGTGANRLAYVSLLRSQGCSLQRDMAPRL